LVFENVNTKERIIFIYCYRL